MGSYISPRATADAGPPLPLDRGWTRIPISTTMPAPGEVPELVERA